MSGIFTAAEKGEMILARPKIGGKLPDFWPIFRASYLTAPCGVADNNGLIRGSGKSPRLNQDGLSFLRDFGRGGLFA